MKPGEVVHMGPAPADGVCAVHDWPTEGLARRLIDAMRERHGKGGVTVCVDCLVRARQDAAEVSRVAQRKARGG